MLRTVTVVTFHFVKPQTINSESFYRIKELMKYDADYNYNPFNTGTFYENFSILIKIIGVGVFALPLSLLWEFLAIIPALAFVFLMFYLCCGGFVTLISFFRMKYKENRYKETINKVIKESITYDQMLLTFDRYY